MIHYVEAKTRIFVSNLVILLLELKTFVLDVWDLEWYGCVWLLVDSVLDRWDYAATGRLPRNIAALASARQLLGIL